MAKKTIAVEIFMKNQSHFYNRNAFQKTAILIRTVVMTKSVNIFALDDGAAFHEKCFSLHGI